MTGWEFLRNLHTLCQFTSRERLAKGSCPQATSSELKRWAQQSVLRINGNVIQWNEAVPSPDEINSITLFKGKARITIL